MPRTLSVVCSAIPQYKGESILQALRLQGREGINSLFEYELFLRTVEDFETTEHGPADWNLDALIREDLSCRIALDDIGTFVPGLTGAERRRMGRGVREINGIVTAAHLWCMEGKQAVYRLILRPDLYLATLSTDCRVFLNSSVEEIIRTLLGPHVPGPDFTGLGHYPSRDYQVQYNESDFAFFERLCQEWGINYHFEHARGRTTLVLADASGCYRPSGNEAYQEIEFQPPGWRLDAEYLHEASLGLRLTSASYATNDYDYTRSLANLQVERTPQPLEHARGSVYEFHGAGAAASHYAQPEAGTQGPNEPWVEGRFLADRRMQALRSGHSRLQARGNLRGMVPGCRFELVKHPTKALNASWVVIDTEFLLEEVGQTSQQREPGGGGPKGWRVRVALVGHPADEALRPAPTRAKPLSGPQTAVVAGPPGHAVWTDGHGRIKVKFPWDRSDRPNGSSSCWIRVASSRAGDLMGAIALPRVGHEVLIDFIGGDPDLPVCVDALHNQFWKAPWALPMQAALSGMRSQEFPEANGANQCRGNELVFDDTRDELQVQLKSDHQHSQLSLGYITRIVEHTGRQEKRGEGFDLRTDGHGAVRAAGGLILSTHERKAASGGQKDLRETADLLARAQEQLAAHALGAIDLQAQDAGDQQRLAERIKAQNTQIAGTSPKPLGELEAPHLLAASGAGVIVAASHDTHIAAGENIALTSTAHTSVSAGGSLLASAAHAIRLLAHRGMRLFTAKGDLQVQALNDNLRLSARQTAGLVSTDGWVSIEARQGIRLNVGGTCIEITAQNIALLTEGRIEAHSAGLEMAGPSSRAMRLNRTPETAFDDRYRLRDPEGRLLANRAWRAEREDGSVLRGTSDAQARIDLQRSDAPDAWNVEAE